VYIVRNKNLQQLRALLSKQHKHSTSKMFAFAYV